VKSIVVLYYWLGDIFHCYQSIKGCTVLPQEVTATASRFSFVLILVLPGVRVVCINLKTCLLTIDGIIQTNTYCYP
jgi:hypothetical protein